MVRGELKKLSSLFDKYKERLIAPEATVIDAFAEVVKDLLGFDIDKKKIRYSPASKTLSLVGSGALRSELKLHEKEILTHLTGRLGKKSVPLKIL